MYKKWYTQKQSLDIKFFDIPRKQWNIYEGTKRGCLAQKLLSHSLLYGNDLQRFRLI